MYRTPRNIKQKKHFSHFIQTQQNIIPEEHCLNSLQNENEKKITINCVVCK